MKKILTLTAMLAWAATAHAKLNVVTTTPDLGAIAAEIGGDKVEVTTLCKPTEDPHFVDAKPSFGVKLNKADVVLEGGAELEIGYLPRLLDDARNKKLEAGQPNHIAAYEGIQMMEVPSTLDRSKGDIHAAGNPHFMSDPASGRIVAEHICKTLSQLDPADSAVFEANLKKFQDHLDAKLAEWKKLLAPYQGREVVSYHNAWPYFAARFGLKMELFLEPKPGIPPSPAHLAEIIGKMKSENAHVIIVQAYQNRKTAETVASHAEGVVLDFPLFPGEKQTYTEWLDGLVNSLAKALAAK